MVLIESLMDRFREKVLNRLDPWERHTIWKMRAGGTLFFLSELIPRFRHSKIYAFGTGGSVANIDGLERIERKNLMIVTTGPVHFYRKYGVMPNIWIVHNLDSVMMLLKEERKTSLDFSATFILVPSNDSYSKLHFSSPLVKELRRRHPETTFVLYREIFTQITDFSIPANYMEIGVEPLRAHHGSVLEALFIPLCGYLGVHTLYFSGIDQLPTGHFWDRNFAYQDIHGKLLRFPEHESTTNINEILMKLCQERGLFIRRLEREETILKIYPYISFEDSLVEASDKITPETIRNYTG